MRLTSFADCGLRALMRAAAAPEAVLTTEGIAAELQISRHHLTKVVRELAAAGIVKTGRGAGGGFTQTRPAAQVSRGEVVRLLEARLALVECFRADERTCVLVPRCRLKGHLARAEEAFLPELDQVSLAACAIGPPDMPPAILAAAG